jgi:hypothetical protein
MRPAAATAPAAGRPSRPPHTQPPSRAVRRRG